MASIIIMYLFVVSSGSSTLSTILNIKIYHHLVPSSPLPVNVTISGNTLRVNWSVETTLVGFTIDTVKDWPQTIRPFLGDQWNNIKTFNFLVGRRAKMAAHGVDHERTQRTTQFSVTINPEMCNNKPEVDCTNVFKVETLSLMSLDNDDVGCFTPDVSRNAKILLQTINPSEKSYKLTCSDGYHFKPDVDTFTRCPKYGTWSHRFDGDSCHSDGVSLYVIIGSATFGMVVLLMVIIFGSLCCNYWKKNQRMAMNDDIPLHSVPRMYCEDGHEPIYFEIDQRQTNTLPVGNKLDSSSSGYYVGPNSMYDDTN